MKIKHSPIITIFQPYLLITIAGLLAFAPVSFMIRALKNDIIALEYPINYFISQCIHNGEIPYWFNTWGMGFPLQSNLTWGIFSTPQILFCSFFDYNLYTLHIEFMFFILLAGWSMFHLLHKYFVKNINIAQLLAICYMLSGFMVGSSQWLLYITAAAFIPLVISSLLNILFSPSIKNALQFAIIYTIMFTSVYAAFNIITTYSLLIFLMLWFSTNKKSRKTNFFIFRYLSFGALFTILFCLPSLYFTVELLSNIDRGEAIAANASFFNSNYLHPAALSNMLFPLASVKMKFANTEGTMFHTYCGLFILTLFPWGIWKTIKEKKRIQLLLLLASLVFLIISFGDMLPFRSAINILPGFSYFRNPAIFRFYFILFLLLFLAVQCRNISFSDLFIKNQHPTLKIVKYTLWVLLLVCFGVFMFSVKSLNYFQFGSLTDFIKNISLQQAILISSTLQLLIILTLLFFIKKQKISYIKFILVADLVINTLACTPFYTVSSYSMTEVNQILKDKKKFPIQERKLAEVPTTYTDYKMNNWNNINVFSKEVSSKDAYLGPLILKNNYTLPPDSVEREILFNNPILFIKDLNSSVININIHKPTHIQASIISDISVAVTLMQNNYVGWTAFYNNKKIDFIKNEKPGMTIIIPGGEGIMDFRYERKAVWISALIIHLITISFLIWKFYVCLKRIKLNRLPLHSSFHSMIH